MPSATALPGPAAPAAPPAAPGAVTPATRDRVLDAALASFATRGYEATSLDALASGLGVRKQTILYYFASKEALLDAVLDRTVAELAAAIERGLARPGEPWARVEAVVTAVFRVTGRRPELLGLTREVTRLGEPFLSRLAARAGPLLARGTAFLTREVAGDRISAGDTHAVLLGAYAALIGAGTEAEVLRQLGVAPSPRWWWRRRRALLDDLARLLRRSDQQSSL